MRAQTSCGIGSRWTAASCVKMFAKLESMFMELQPVVDGFGVTETVVSFELYKMTGEDNEQTTVPAPRSIVDMGRGAADDARWIARHRHHRNLCAPVPCTTSISDGAYACAGERCCFKSILLHCSEDTLTTGAVFGSSVGR